MNAKSQAAKRKPPRFYVFLRDAAGAYRTPVLTMDATTFVRVERHGIHGFLCSCVLRPPVALHLPIGLCTVIDLRTNQEPLFPNVPDQLLR